MRSRSWPNSLVMMPQSKSILGLLVAFCRLTMSVPRTLPLGLRSGGATSRPRLVLKPGRHRQRLTAQTSRRRRKTELYNFRSSNKRPRSCASSWRRLSPASSGNANNKTKATRCEIALLFRQRTIQTTTNRKPSLPNQT